MGDPYTLENLLLFSQSGKFITTSSNELITYKKQEVNVLHQHHLTQALGKTVRIPGIMHSTCLRESVPNSPCHSSTVWHNFFSTKKSLITTISYIHWSFHSFCFFTSLKYWVALLTLTGST